MQFQYNSDYPDRFYNDTNNSMTSNDNNVTNHPSLRPSSTNTTSTSTTTTTTPTITTTNHRLHHHINDARDPYHFPPVQPISCARITTRIYNPLTQTITTVPNVLIKTQTIPMGVTTRSSNRRSLSSQQQQHRLSVQSFDLNQFSPNMNNDDDKDIKMNGSSSSSSSDSDFSDDDDDDDDQKLNADGVVDPLLLLQQQQHTTTDDNHIINEDDDDEYDNNDNPNHIAYWIQNIIREAIYGRVYKAIVLRKIHPRRKQQIAYQLLVLQQQQQQTAQSPSMYNHNNNNNVEWEITNYDCAIKEMSWQHIRKERDHLAEDPIKEVCAMQYFKSWYDTNTTPITATTTMVDPTNHTNNYSMNHNNNNHANYQSNDTATSIQQQQQQSSIPMIPTTTTQNSTTTSTKTNTNNNRDIISTSFQQMLQTNVMMPLDLLSDEQYLYSIMPFCNGGELFELLNMNDRFHENEARYWMKQVLNGIECMQHAGICHRDMSLENLLVHENGTVLIIDMGMCLRVPFQLTPTNTTNQQQQQHYGNNDSTRSLSTTFNDINIAATGVPDMMTASAIHEIDPNNVPDVPSVRNLRRHMMKPQGTCGKWHYMSPEIHNNREPFDGYSVDMWAAGVILFLMLTGFPPWDRPSPTDERFKYMSAGYLVQMLTEWEIGLSPDAMDLLQRMMFLDPKDRLSLDQVRAHPWMVNGPCTPPSTINTF